MEKTKIKAEIVLDSIASSGIRLTTMVITFPRFILPEFNTHRMFSRNASSSRAIPASKMIEKVKNDPFFPAAFTENKPGMQADKEIQEQELATKAWLLGRDKAVETAQELLALGVHKQHLNRVLEPYMWTTVVVSATDWDNFFALRCHPAAQPEIHALADEMFRQYCANVPVELEDGQWHLPFVEKSEIYQPMVPSSKTILIKKSVARCARVSYLNHDGTSSTLEQDCQLYDRLLGSKPIHASPAEHQAMATGDANLRSGNFRGWIQFRKTLPEENVLNFYPLDDFEWEKLEDR